jgi:hypothetical protein
MLHFYSIANANDPKVSKIKKEENGNYTITYNRNKPRGKQVKNWDTFTVIAGKLEVDTLDKYVACFPINSNENKKNIREGRFFRYLQLSKCTRKMYVSTAKPIGINVCAAVGKDIATFLNLPNPERFTGQCWRGTASTFLADHGHTAAQIRAVTGHSSEKSLQVYVDNSNIQKLATASSLSLNGPVKSISVKRKRCTDKGGNNNIYITMNNSTAANISINQSKDDEDVEDHEDEVDEVDDEEFE